MFDFLSRPPLGRVLRTRIVGGISAPGQPELDRPEEGVPDPAVGDRTFQEWDILPVCTPLKGACNVTLFGWELVRLGRVYRRTLPSSATCEGQEVEGRRTVTLRVTDAEVLGRVLTVSAFTGTSEVTFRCGGDAVRAVAGITGTLPELAEGRGRAPIRTRSSLSDITTRT